MLEVTENPDDMFVLNSYIPLKSISRYKLHIIHYRIAQNTNKSEKKCKIRCQCLQEDKKKKKKALAYMLKSFSEGLF